MEDGTLEELTRGKPQLARPADTYPPMMMPAERYPGREAAPEAFGPVSPAVFATLQEIVNRVACEALVDRKVLHVDYVDAVVPDFVLPRDEPEAECRADECGAPKIKFWTPKPPDPDTGKLLQVSVPLDCDTLDLLERDPGRANVANLVNRVRALARAEVAEVVRILLSQDCSLQCVASDSATGDPAAQDAGTESPPDESPEGVGARVLQGVIELQTSGYGGDLAVVFSKPGWTTILGDAVKAQGTRLLDRLETEVSGNIFVVPAEGFTALVIATSPDAVRLVVGRNFSVRWMSATGLDQNFAIEVGFRVVVNDCCAIRVVK